MQKSIRMMHKPRVIGLTGCIGAGKTLVSKIFCALRVPIFNSDQVARRLQNSDQTIIKQIKHYFGAGVFNINDVLDRKLLAQIVFDNPCKLELLNNLIHPEVRKKFDSWLSVQKSPYVIKESALLFASMANRAAHTLNILVKAELDTIIERVVRRSSISSEQVLKIIRSQPDMSSYQSEVDYVINNNAGHQLVPQVVEIHRNILAHINNV